MSIWWDDDEWVFSEVKGSHNAYYIAKLKSDEKCFPELENPKWELRASKSNETWIEAGYKLLVRCVPVRTVAPALIEEWLPAD